MTDYQDNVASKMSKMLEDTISEALIKAIQNLSIEIDEEELLKMLRDSKKQYQRGYNDRDSEIIRCKDCKYYDPNRGNCQNGTIHGYAGTWYCSDGERR